MNTEVWQKFLDVIEFESCGCGKNLEQSLAFDRTTLLKFFFQDEDVRLKVICDDCMRKTGMSLQKYELIK